MRAAAIAAWLLLACAASSRGAALGNASAPTKPTQASRAGDPPAMPGIETIKAGQQRHQIRLNAAQAANLDAWMRRYTGQPCMDPRQLQGMAVIASAVRVMPARSYDPMATTAALATYVRSMQAMGSQVQAWHDGHVYLSEASMPAPPPGSGIGRASGTIAALQIDDGTGTVILNCQVAGPVKPRSSARPLRFK